MIWALMLLAAVLSGGGSWWFTSEHHEKLALEVKVKADKDVADANDRATEAAFSYESWKALQRPKTITVTREVEREIKADTDCSARPLPAGLRDALVKAGANADQPVADGAVPAAPAAGLYELGRPGARVPGNAERTARLLGQAEGPR